MEECPAKLDPAKAFEAIQKILDEGDETLSWNRPHVRDRMEERKVTIDDVLKVLRTGMVSPSARWDEQRKHWRYLVTGRDCDDAPLGVAIAIEPRHCRITLITVEDVN